MARFSPFLRLAGILGLSALLGFAAVTRLAFPNLITEHPPAGGDPDGKVTKKNGAGPPQAPWLNLQGAARLISCVNFEDSVSAHDWPLFFEMHQRDELLRPALIRQWAKRDPAGFWDWIARQKDPGLISEAGKLIFESWAAKDPDAALAGAARIGDERMRRPLEDLIMNAALKRNPVQALTLMQKRPSVFLSPSTDWMESDPEAALRVLSAQPSPGKAYARMLSTALRLVAEKDPAAALAWVGSHAKDATAQEVTEALKVAAASQPEAAIRLAAAIPEDAKGNSVLKSVLPAATQLSAEEMFRLAAKFAPGTSRAELLSTVVSATAESAPAQAAELWKQLPPCENSRVAGVRVAETFSKSDWPAAAAWVESLDEPPVRRQAWQQLAMRVPGEQTAALAARVAALPLSDLTDDFLRTVRDRITNNLGEKARDQWAAGLPPIQAEWLRALRD